MEEDEAPMEIEEAFNVDVSVDRCLGCRYQCVSSVWMAVLASAVT